MSNLASPSDILRILPHRYPFLFVDQVTEFIPGQRIAATKRFSVDDAATRGYLPASPIISVGILLELVTQLGAILVMERPEMAGKVARNEFSYLIDEQKRVTMRKDSEDVRW